VISRFIIESKIYVCNVSELVSMMCLPFGMDSSRLTEMQMKHYIYNKKPGRGKGFIQRYDIDYKKAFNYIVKADATCT
jgi:hypothetical protein